MSMQSDLEAAQKKVNQELQNIFVGGSISICNAIIEESPVISGRFRGNWQPTINTPAEGEIGDAKTEEFDIPKTDTLVKATVKDTLYLTNNLPYAEGLEIGPHVKQRPIGWVRNLMSTGQKAIDDKLNGKTD